jgi:hypothetical protein
MMYIPKGALILTRGKGWFAKVILWGQKSWGESPSRVNHSLLVVEGGFYPSPKLTREPIIIESDAVVRTGFLSHYHRNDKLVVYDLGLTEEERDLVCEHAGRHSGAPYAVLQLIGQLIDNKLFFGLNIFRRLSRIDPLDICSRLTGEAFASIGITFGEPDYAQSPDDQDDFLRLAILHGGKVHGRPVRCLIDEVGY